MQNIWYWSRQNCNISIIFLRMKRKTGHLKIETLCNIISYHDVIDLVYLNIERDGRDCRNMSKVCLCASCSVLTTFCKMARRQPKTLNSFSNYHVWKHKSSNQDMASNCCFFTTNTYDCPFVWNNCVFSQIRPGAGWRSYRTCSVSFCVSLCQRMWAHFLIAWVNAKQKQAVGKPGMHTRTKMAWLL